MDYLALLGTVFYLLCGCLAINKLLQPRSAFNKWILGTSSLALIIHGIWLYQNIFLISGQNLPILNVLSLASFVIALLSVLVSRRLNTGVLLPVVFAFNILNFIAVAHLPGRYITHLESNPQVGAHIILALLAYAILSIASLFALQLAYLDYRLKSRKAPLTQLNLPPLMTLEKSLFQFISVGFVLLSCALITGFIFLEDFFASGSAHKAILSILAWIIYAVILWGHFSKGWRGRLIIYITILASSILSLAYFGSRFVKEIILT
ncbi:MAG: cytochrome c biogenesis protein CcsA [Psychromonas sp.]